jgi:hypothetical protein
MEISVMKVGPVHWFFKASLGLSLFGVVAGTVLGDDKADIYQRDVKPLLRERCYACHGALKQEGGLRLDTANFAQRGGESGVAFTIGDAAGSLLIERVTAVDDGLRMPPEGHPLTDHQIQLLSRWIQSGAEAPEDELPELDPSQHWAFRQPIRPAIPESSASLRNRIGATPNAIDHLIHAGRESVGVLPLPQADRDVLLRRVYLDLIGIPPTSDELLAFLADDSETAYEQVVDRLLDSPMFGERWGRHWMDVWRYSDWYGRRSVPDVMNSYPMLWRWRDWIVRSLNEDKPYDRMIVEMLAADELFADDEQKLVATGYLVRSWFKWNYETWKKDLVEHTGKAFLGMTFNCAQCHDHKYDPVSQEEYFRFRAFFEPLELRHERVPGEPDPGAFQKYIYGKPYGPIRSGMVRVFDEYLDAETYMFSNGDSRLKHEGKPPVSPGVPMILGGDRLQIAAITVPIAAAYPGMKDFVRKEEVAAAVTAVATAEKNLARAQEDSTSEPAELLQELDAATAGLQSARQQALARISQDKSIGIVLRGQQSLFLDARSGRRALSHPLTGLDSLADQASVSWLVHVVQDGHTNLQLALDIQQGATGGFVAFESGTVKTYAPGGFNELIAGTYDPQLQKRFQVSMKLDLAQDQFLLTVLSLDNDQVVVDAVPAGLNGWKPQFNGRRGLFVDCRPGTAVAYDQLMFLQPDGESLLCFDFEPPDFSEGTDVVDTALAGGEIAWRATQFCQAPASSVIISAVSESAEVKAAVARLAAVQKTLKMPILKIAAAEAELQAALKRQESIACRIAADDARYADGLLASDRKADPEVRKCIERAWQSERQAMLAAATSALSSAEVQLAEAEIQSAAAADQASVDAAREALKAAQLQRTAAENALHAAGQELSKEPADYTPLATKYAQVSSGRRSALANWIANKQNPLTARVAVNHIWLRHFGRALVETTDNFGRNGSLPTHPELLDWLACELMDSGWSLKHVHRLIVTSQSYRLTSIPPGSDVVKTARYAESAAVDPDNRTYWRFPSARMEAEVVRDSLLAVAGELDTTMGGHEIDHKLGMTSRRRSLYFAHHGEEKMEFLELFDGANACDCYKRSSSVQPQQALALANSELTKSLSRQLESRLWMIACDEDSELPVDNRFVRLAFLQVLNREPRDAEQSAALEFLNQQRDRLQSIELAEAVTDPALRSRQNLIHALMNHHDFVTIR